MTHTVVGLFDDRSEAKAAMQELLQEGFVKENIDLSNRSENVGGDEYDSADSDLGITDRIGNFFNSLFNDDPAAASNYTSAASDAEAILTVQVDSDERARAAQEIFDRHGAMDADERGAEYESQNNAGTQGRKSDGKTVIPIVEEELQVGKRQVERSGVQVRSRIIEKPVEEQVRLREEHVVVNRRPVNRAVNDNDLKNFREGEMEITERAEVPIVGKQARVVEEVEIGKNVNERKETVRDTVRRKDVDVEEFDKTNDRNDDVRSRTAKP